MKSFKKYFYLLSFVFVVCLALLLRTSPGHDHYIWSFDQARDAYRTRVMIPNKDIKLVGAQTEFVGLSHGPIFYYYMSPFFYLSNGDPNLPALAMILLNMSTMIPLTLLSYRLFKNKWIVLCVLFLFAISYEQIEYARWISNVSTTIPFIAWIYYFLHRVFSNEYKKISMLGIFTGFAIQGEIFLLYLIPLTIFLFVIKKTKVSTFLLYVLGLIVGLLPFILAEVKFHFLGVKTFVFEFLLSHSPKTFALSSKIQGYIAHMSMTAEFSIFGVSLLWAGLLLFVLLCLSMYFFITKKNDRSTYAFLFLLLFSHSILFFFKYIDAVFLNLGIGLTMILLFTKVFTSFKLNKAAIISTLVVVFALQTSQLYTFTSSNAPFNMYSFIQTGILFSQKMDIVTRIYTLSKGEPFSLSVLGTPYGVRTVWASVFEQYTKRNNASLPVMYGDVANGYEGEYLLPKEDAPKSVHILLIEPNSELISDPIKNAFLKKQNDETNVLYKETLYGYTIELRTPKK